MKNLVTFITVLILMITVGCEQQAGQRISDEQLEDGRVLLSVDFTQGQTLRYKFTSDRQIKLYWEPETDTVSTSKVDTYSEFSQIVMAYTPIEVDPYGLTKIKAECEDVTATRKDSKAQPSAMPDALGYFKGKSFELTVRADGTIEDYSGLEQIIKQAVESSFRKGTTGGRIKEPEMIGDFIATQWFLWDAVSSIENPARGLEVGQSWDSILSAPTPFITRWPRKVDYTLTGIETTDNEKLAVIDAKFSPAEQLPENFVIPYEGRFQVSGPFGFLMMFVRQFEVTSLQGSGKEIFNITAGQAQSYEHNYDLVLDAVKKSALGTKPRLAIKQKLTMQKLD